MITYDTVIKEAFEEWLKILHEHLTDIIESHRPDDAFKPHSINTR